MENKRLLGSNLAKKILRLLQDKSLTRKEIASETGNSINSVNSYLYGMLEKGLVEKDEMKEVESGHIANTFKTSKTGFEFLELEEKRSSIKTQMTQMLESQEDKGKKGGEHD